MSHIWSRSFSDWAVAILDGEEFFLTAEGVRRAGSAPALPGPALRRFDDDSWVLIDSGESAVRVNGLPLAVGARVLDDRDEIRQGGADPLYFSTERQARIEPFPGAPEPVFCVRSRVEIAAGTPSVRCPGAGCGVWYIEDEAGDMQGWSYTESCAACGHPTDLDGGFVWSPHSLWSAEAGD